MTVFLCSGIRSMSGCMWCSEDGRRNLWGWAIKWTKDAVCVHLDTEIHGYRRVWVAPCDVVRR